MTELEDKLRKTLNDEGEFNKIPHTTFTKTETEKNQIVENQIKKLSNLTDTRHCSIDPVPQVDRDP